MRSKSTTHIVVEEAADNRKSLLADVDDIVGSVDSIARVVESLKPGAARWVMISDKFNFNDKYHSTRFAVDIARLQVMEQLLSRLPKHSRIVAVLRRFGDCLVHHHLLQCRRQHVDAILERSEGQIENYSRLIMSTNKE